MQRTSSGDTFAGACLHGKPLKTNTMRNRNRQSGFTLVELLIVISIIGIIAAMVISSYSNAAQDTRKVVALQQQAELQGAINNWVASQDSLSQAKTAYASKTSAQRLTLISSYLNAMTLAQFDANEDGAFDVDSDGALVSVVMGKVSQSVELADWATGSYPQVILNK